MSLDHVYTNQINTGVHQQTLEESRLGWSMRMRNPLGQITSDTNASYDEDGKGNT